MFRFHVLIAFLVLLASCGGEKRASATSFVIYKVKQQDRQHWQEQARLGRRQKIEETARLDSIQMDRILQNAFKLADQNSTKNSWKKTYSTTTEDGFSVEVELKINQLFTAENTHLLIRRKSSSDVYVDIYLRKNGAFEKVLSHKQWSMEYTGDTIRDLNGDGIKDFVVDWYGSNGCCLKGFSDVYLMRKDGTASPEKYSFINPTFSPNEKVIRGVCYGHPGETEMYKYRWNGERVDTVEYIYFERDEKGKLTGKVVRDGDLPSEDVKAMKKLNTVPLEYKKIGGYDWFIGKP